MMVLVWDGKAQSGDRPRNEGLQREISEKNGGPFQERELEVGHMRFRVQLCELFSVDTEISKPKSLPDLCV